MQADALTGIRARWSEQGAAFDSRHFPHSGSLSAQHLSVSLGCGSTLCVCTPHLNLADEVSLVTNPQAYCSVLVGIQCAAEPSMAHTVALPHALQQSSKLSPLVFPVPVQTSDAERIGVDQVAKIMPSGKASGSEQCE